MKEDLTDTEAALVEDREFLADLEKSCATKTADWEERSKMRADELVALADTIKILNDDDALDLFKNTLKSASSSASFVQMASSVAAVRSRALEAISLARRHSNPQDQAGLDFLMVALSGKKSMAKGGFDKVVAMIDKMVEVLKQEQSDDDHKKEYCGIQLDQTDDKKKALAHKIDDTETNIGTTNEAIATLKEEIKGLEGAIKALDKSVADATDQRKAENLEFKDLMAQNGAAKELLAFAKNRLNQFYNPKLYKAPAKRELSSQDRIAVNMGGDAPTEAPSGIAGTGIGAALVQLSARKGAPPPPPETFGPYSKKGDTANGVIAMIDLLIADLDKEMQEASVSEKNSQQEYEVMMKASAAKRAADSKSITDKAAEKASTGEAMQGEKESKDA